MSVSKSQQKAVNKYIEKKYDRINLTLPKGDKERIRSYAKKTGESVNSYIARAIEHQMYEELTTGRNNKRWKKPIKQK